ncbi:MAG: M48 family metallopeptidase [Acidimicrobiales bacterium]
MYTEIASNKRRSVILVIVFFIVWMAIGGALGLLFRAIDHPVNNGIVQTTSSQSWAPVIVGLVIGAILAFIGFLYSLTSGARTVLRVSGAVPADPGQYQQLHNLVEALAIGDGIPKPAVYVINDPSPNAFATGISPQKASITFTTGLLATMNREELEGVASHEMSHIKNHDIRLLLIVGTMIGMAALLASVLWRGAFFAGGGRGRNGNQIVIIIFAAGLLLAIVGFIFGPLIRLALSRRRESLADVSGVELTRNPAGLLSALKKLQQNDKPFKGMNHSTAAMCIDDPLQHHDAWYHHLYDTHPPLEDRIAALEKIASGQSV